MIIKEYDGRKLEGLWCVDYKIDGIRCERTKDSWISRSGKDSLYGLDHLISLTEEGDIFEYYLGTWEESSAIRRHDHVCNKEDLYQLYPLPDTRLACSIETNIDSTKADELLKDAISKGFEGLVFRRPPMFIKSEKDLIRYKYKPEVTYDVKVLSLYEGKSGKNIGRLGGIVTEMGKVHHGFSDEDRINFWNNPDSIIGKIVEVKSQGLTKDNKFRHGRLVRIRWDK